MNLRSERKLHSDSGASARCVPIANPDGNSFPLETQRHDRWLTFAVCVFLALAVWSVFGQTLHHEFVNYDDARYVYENPMVTGGISLHAIARTFTHNTGLDQWLPLTDVSHMLDRQIYGRNAGGHHLTNVLLHAATAILLFLVLRKMTGAMWRSAFVAAVFAIHPLRVESVAWVTERKDILSGLFFMLTLFCYAKAVTGDKFQVTGKNRSLVSIVSRVTCHTSPFYWLALLFFTLGLLSKSMLVTLPFVLLLLDYWPLNRIRNSEFGIRNFGKLLLEKIPFFALSAASCVVTVLTQKNAMLALQGVTFPWRVGNALVAYTDYLWQMFYPVDLAVLYPHPGNHLSVLRVGLSVLLLLLLSTSVMAVGQKQPYLLVGWLWFLGMLVPVIGLIQVGEQARADRYTYLPQIGLYILVAWGAVELCDSWRHRRAVLGSAAAAIFGGLLAGAYVQTGYWKNSASLWTHTLACTSENPSAHFGLGMALADDEGKMLEAIQHYERALQIKPDFPEAHYNLGIALADQGKLDDAIQHYERAIQLKPDYAEALNNLGNALGAEGRLPEAIQLFERAIQAQPGFAEAHYDLGVALARQRKLNVAIPHFQQAIALATAQNNTALADSIRTRLKPFLPDLAQPQTP